MATKTKSGFSERRLAMVLMDYELLLKAGAYDKEELARIVKESKKAMSDTTIQSTRDTAQKVLEMAEEALAK